MLLSQRCSLATSRTKRLKAILADRNAFRPTNYLGAKDNWFKDLRATFPDLCGNLKIIIITSRIRNQSIKVYKYNGGGASKTNAVQGRVNLWIEFVNTNIYNPSVFGCWRRAFAGLECSQGGEYIYIVIPMSLGPGWLFLGHRRGLGLGRDVGILATPRNRLGGGKIPPR